MGIRFLDGSFEEILQELDLGGVMVVPAAPALATVSIDRDYHAALKESRFAIFDSGFFCLLLLFKGFFVKKLSGLTFLRLFLHNINRLEAGSIFLVDPSPEDAYANRDLLARYGYKLCASHQYTAPMYPASSVRDEALVANIQSIRPKYIMLNLGGGVQEKLGVYLSKHLDYAPSIICTGAAIAFLTGRQVSISPLMDRFYLGWLGRCISDYRRFIPRYFYGLRLIPLLIHEKFEEYRL